MSPELIAPQRFGFKNSHPTKFSDCYALGMVVYETISGNLPFHEHTDFTVIAKVLEGQHPPRGARFTKTLWEMLELCWAQPNKRPSIESVLQCLEMVSMLSEPPFRGTDEGLGGDSTSDDWDSTTNPSGILSEVNGTMTTKLTTAFSGLDDPRLKTWSPGLSFLADGPLRPFRTASRLSISEATSNADVDGSGGEVVLLTTQTDSDVGSASQVSEITIHYADPRFNEKRIIQNAQTASEVAGEAEKPDLDAQTPINYRFSTAHDPVRHHSRTFLNIDAQFLLLADKRAPAQSKRYTL